MDPKTALVIIANGVEEIETFAVINALRRAQVCWLICFPLYETPAFFEMNIYFMQKQKLNHNSCMRNLEKIPICVQIYFNDFQLFNTIIIESIAMPLTCNVNSIYYFRTFVGKSDSCRSIWYCPNQRCSWHPSSTRKDPLRSFKGMT